MHSRIAIACLAAVCQGAVSAAEPATLNVWPGKPPGETTQIPPEEIHSDPAQGPVAGRGTVRISNVSTPTLMIYRPSPEHDTQASVVICPGGAHRSLAWAHEGTEVAEWLAGIGVTGIVLKYRVPFRDADRRWLAGVQDAQRAVSLVRNHAVEWRLDPKRIGLLGFSAGGQIAGLVASLPDRQYPPADDIDRVSSRPDFAVLIYPGGFENAEKSGLREDIRISHDSPPMFFVHAADDPHSVLNSLWLATALTKAKVPVELHIFAKGGHGFGLRHVDGKPATDWPGACQAWMQTMGFFR